MVQTVVAVEGDRAELLERLIQRLRGAALRLSGAA